MSDSHRDDLYKIIYATAYQTPATNRSSINPLTTLLYEVIPLKLILILRMRMIGCWPKLLAQRGVRKNANTKHID